MGSVAGRTRRTRVSLLNGIPADVLADLPPKVPADEVLDYLESQLRVESRVSTYDLYERVAKRERAGTRREAFLKELAGR
ncbi:MAG: hypothetical protein JKY65_20610 [Planctomycetes bacterium]|nr:hypothetical protein [Planctomycetota bacterium]